MENDRYIKATQEYEAYCAKRKQRIRKFKAILATHVPALPENELQELQEETPHDDDAAM